MRFDREPRREIVGRGQLYTLSHPGSEMFSGYGLTLQDGRRDHLAGVLMIDRPQPVHPEWLEQVKALYGDYQLTPMTASGERGILTQMRITPESMHFLKPAPIKLVVPFTKALQPLLDEPPAPILKLSWDVDHTLWRSEFWIGLPPALQEVFRRHGYGCLAVSDGEKVSFVTHASDRDIESFRPAQVAWRWELHELPTAPLIRFRATILDRVYGPYQFEHFLNLDDPEQARYLSLLVRQEELSLDLFGDEFEYAYSKPLSHPKAKQAALAAIVRRAIEYYGSVPKKQRDFDKAKAEFQRTYPL